jgi:hypothetical protein
LRKYSWLYLFAFVRPSTGELWCWRTTTVTAAGMSQLLQVFAQELGLGPQRHLVLVVDNAGWHRSKHLVLPEGLHLVYLPAYSPELQPVERVALSARSPRQSVVATPGGDGAESGPSLQLFDGTSRRNSTEYLVSLVATRRSISSINFMRGIYDNP